jgi:hypothetical protein
MYTAEGSAAFNAMIARTFSNLYQWAYSKWLTHKCVSLNKAANRKRQAALWANR